MYDYEVEKAELFTEAGQVMFLAIRDKVHKLLKTAGAFRLQEAIANQSGSGWQMLACIDRLIELGEITEITPSSTAGQYQVYIARHK